MDKKTGELQVIQPEQYAVQTTMERLLSAVQSGLSAEMLEKFMDLAERQEKREAEKAYNQAFAEFKKNPPEIFKDKKVDYTTKAGNKVKYEHATIGNVVKEIIKGLALHGLSHSWSMEQNGKDITVTCRLKHFMGHSEEATLTASADESGGKNPIQAISSANTYLQRYTLQAVTGLAILEIDDDGRGAGASFPQAREKKQAKPKTEPKPADRTIIDGWLKWLEGAKSPGVTKAIFAAEWAKNKLDDVCNSLHPDFQKELLDKEADVLKYLEGK